MRRRHGIPDDDNRPFNVAYAAALQARKTREGMGRLQRGGSHVVSLDDEDERLGNPGMPRLALVVSLRHPNWLAQ